MKVDITKLVPVQGKPIPVHAGTHEVDDQITCQCGDARVEVRDVGGGQLVVVISGAKVSLEPRAAGIWINVEEARSRTSIYNTSSIVRSRSSRTSISTPGASLGGRVVRRADTC